MNLQAIKRNCLARGEATLLNIIGGGQWISDGVAAWPVYHGLRLDEDGLRALFNLSSKQLENMYIGTSTYAEPRFRRSIVDGEENTKVAAEVRLYGEIMLALPSSRGTLYIPLEAVRHIKEDYRGYAVRWEYGRPLVAVYSGLMVEAIVTPLDNTDAEKIRGMANALLTPYRWGGDEEEAAEAEKRDEERVMEG